MTVTPGYQAAVEVSGTPVSGRVPPHDLEAERAVLGSLMIDQAAISEIRDLVDPGDFYAERHQHIYRVALGENRTGSRPDLVHDGPALDFGRKRLKRVGI